MVSVLQGTRIRKEQKHKWWMYKLLFLCVVSALALGISLTFFHTKAPIFRDTSVRESLPNFESFHSEYYSLRTYSIMQTGTGGDHNNGTNNDEDEEEVLNHYFRSINASKSCDFGSVPYNMTCSYLHWNQSGCSEDNKYLGLLHCTALHEAPGAFYFLAVLVVLIAFYLLGDTAEAYFSPSLIKISNYLNLSPNLAGITLLALGNGAPDLSSIIVGIVANGNSEFGVGEPVGSGTFVTSCVMAGIVLLSDVKGLARRPFIRDVLFYIVSVAYTFYLYIDGRVYIWESIICLLIYVVYVLTVIISRIIYKRIKARRERLKGLPRRAAKLQQSALGERLIEEGAEEKASDLSQEPESAEVGQTPENSEAASQQEVELIDTDAKAVVEEGSDSEEEEQWAGWRHRFIKDDIFKEVSVKDSKTLDRVATSRYYVPKIGLIESKKTETATGEKEEEREHKYIITDYFQKENSDKVPEPAEKEEEEEELKGPKKYFFMFLDSIGWSEMAWYQKITFILFEWFWILLRNLTIPKSEDEEWNKWFAMCIPIFSPLIILILPGYDKFIFLIGGAFPVAVLLIIIGSFFSIVIFFTTRRNKPPRYHPIFVCLAFPMCIFWIFIIANELLDVLDAVGLNIGIPTSVLAITVLSWGNSISDMIADIVLSRQGYPSMALGAVFAGPMLNLLIGLFVALTFNPIQLTNFCFPLTEDPTVNVSFIFLLISLISSVIVVPVFKFKAPKLFGVYLIALYLIYLTLALLAALYPPVTQAFTWRDENMCGK